MKRVDSRVSTSCTSSVLDFQKVSVRDEREDEEFSFPIENFHKIVTLPSPTSVTERVVWLESISDDYMGPQTPQRIRGEDSEDEADIETELVKVAPIPTVGPRSPVLSSEYRPCDPVAKFLLSQC